MPPRPKWVGGHTGPCLSWSTSNQFETLLRLDCIAHAFTIPAIDAIAVASTCEKNQSGKRKPPSWLKGFLMQKYAKPMNSKAVSNFAMHNLSNAKPLIFVSFPNFLIAKSAKTIDFS